MLTADEKPTIKHRVKGRAPLLKSLRALLLRVARFGNHRATTDDDRLWTARLLDRLQAAVDVAQGRQDAP